MCVTAIPQQRSVLARKRSVEGSTNKSKASRTKPVIMAGKDESDDEQSGHTALIRSDSFDSTTLPLKSCLKKSSSPSLHANNNKSVSWDSVQVRLHSRVLGDHPSVSSGPPLAISWDSHTSYTASVEDYEKDHPNRKMEDSLLVSRSTREQLLRNAGYTRAEFAQTLRTIGKIKRGRDVSNAQRKSFVNKLLKNTRTG